MKPFDIYRSTSTNVFENLALEEHLLVNSKKDILLFYINENAVVIGKHQNPWKEVDLNPSRNYEIIRRLSGGGTVYHDLGNINFSFIRNKETDFVNFREHIIPINEALKKLYISNTISERNDLFINEKKISGNAEHVNSALRRILHHGTLLYDSNLISLNKSIKPSRPLNIKTHAVNSNRSPVTNIRSIYDWGDTNQFLKKLIFNLTEILSIQSTININPASIKSVNQLIEKRYKTHQWNFGHTPQFQYTDSAGNIFKIRKGKIIESADNTLINKPFEQLLSYD